MSGAFVVPVRLRVERLARTESVVGAESRVASHVETGTATTGPMLPRRTSSHRTGELNAQSSYNGAMDLAVGDSGVGKVRQVGRAVFRRPG
jgi:hypothetical protein